MAVFKDKVKVKVKVKVKNFIMLSLSLNLIIFLYSCATTSNIPINNQIHIIENVPFFAQDAYQCGPASLAGVMNYWNAGITPDEIAKEIYSKPAGGTLDIDMVIYPQRKGMLAEQYSGGMDNLRKNIDAGHPLVVLVDYGFWVLQSNHFMVIIGYNERGVIANSGKEKSVFIAEKDFLKTWERTKFWTLLIKKKPENSRSDPQSESRIDRRPVSGSQSERPSVGESYRAETHIGKSEEK